MGEACASGGLSSFNWCGAGLWLNAPSGPGRAETPAFSPPEKNRWAQGSDGCSSEAGRARVPVVTPPDARGAGAEVLVVE